MSSAIPTCPGTWSLIEDASTDRRLRPWLRTWVAAQEASVPDRITLIENPANLGFIGSVNAGLAVAAARGDDVVLLNSDAFVPERWASRLMRPFLIHDRVATVTPMSNDAEILTVPLACRRTPCDRERPTRSTGSRRSSIPTPRWRTAPPASASAWRSASSGWRGCPRSIPSSVGVTAKRSTGAGRCARWAGGTWLPGGLFVEHRGGTSFGSAEKQRLLTQNNAVISARHPGFDAEVQGFLQADPLMTPRLMLGIAFAAMRVRGRVPVYLAHSLGGGAEDYLTARLSRDLSQDGAGAAIVLRVGGALRWQVELVLPDGVLRGATSEFGFVQRLLQPLPARDIVYSCGVGDADPAGLPDCLLALKRDPDDRIEVLFHDFLPISPSYTLTDSDGHHRGLPDPLDPDPAHCPKDRSLAMWQQAWGRLITAADAVTVFSRDSHRLVLGAFPAGPARDPPATAPHAGRGAALRARSGAPTGDRRAGQHRIAKGGGCARSPQPSSCRGGHGGSGADRDSRSLPSRWPRGRAFTAPTGVRIFRRSSRTMASTAG